MLFAILLQIERKIHDGFSLGIIFFLVMHLNFSNWKYEEKKKEMLNKTMTFN